MPGVARYDGLAEWYDENLRGFTLRWTDDAPGSPRDEGSRRRVGMRHLPLADLLQAFTDAGLALDRFEEPGDGLFLHVFAVVDA
jgi:hypothetical protein